MSLDATKALQLSVMLGQISQLFAGPTSNQGRFAQALIANGQAGIQAEAIKKAKKEEEKKSKSGALGSIGGILGSAAGIALAPVTGGASLALAGGLGGALGSAAGQAIGGGGVDPTTVALSGINGGFQGYDFAKSGLTQKAMNPTPSVDSPQPYLPGDSLVNDVSKSFAYPGSMVGRQLPQAPAPQSYLPNTSIGRDIPMTAQGSPQHIGDASAWRAQFPPVQNTTAQAGGRGFLNRFYSGFQQNRPAQNPALNQSPYIQRTPDGQPDIIWGL